jgi:WD40 repeat protein
MHEPISRAIYSRAETIVGCGGLLHERGIIAIWDATTLERHSCVLSDEQILTALAISPDDASIACCGKSTNCVEIWSLAPLRRIARHMILREPFRRSSSGLRITHTHVAAIGFSSRGDVLALGCWDCTAKVLSATGESVRELGSPHDSNVEFVAFVATDGRLVTACGNTLHIWNTITWRIEASTTLGRHEAWRHVYAADCDSVISASTRGRVAVSHVAKGLVKERIVDLSGSLTCVAYSQAHGCVALAQADGSVSFLHVADLDVVGRVQLAPVPILSIDFAQDGSAMCVVSALGNDGVVQYGLRY